MRLHNKNLKKRGKSMNKSKRYNIPDLEVGMIMEHKSMLAAVTGAAF